MDRRSVVTLTLTLTLAGMLTSSVGSVAHGTGAAAAPTFGTAVRALPRCGLNRCFLPSVAADAAGRIFVTDFDGSKIGVSSDGGASFIQRGAPAPPSLDPRGGGRSVTASVHTDRSGRLFFSSVVLGGPAGTLHGVQVARSSDGAVSWESNVLIRLTAACGGDPPGGPAVARVRGGRCGVRVVPPDTCRPDVGLALR